MTNTVIQKTCPADLSEHLPIGTFDNTAHALTIDARTHDGPADPARLDRSKVCGRLLMPGVNPATFATDFAGPGTLSLTIKRADLRHRGLTRVSGGVHAGPT